MDQSMTKRAAMACSLIVMLGGCAGRAGPATRLEEPPPPNTLSEAERQAGWRLLFDGRTTNGWRGYQSQEMPAEWKVVDGALTREVRAHDIVATEPFEDFELALDWKLGPGGNAGIFYRATEEYEYIFWSGPEYQLLDDEAAPDNRSRLSSAGAAFGIYPAPAGIVKAAGEWNAARIYVKGTHVEHWMNGQKLLEYELFSPAWEERVRASKFRVWPGFGRAKKGYIGIQGDHDGLLAVRNVRIRVLR